MPRSTALLAALLSAGLGACDPIAPEDEGGADGRDDSFLIGGKADGIGVDADGPEAQAVLALVNRASYELLDAPVAEGGVGLDRRAAANIVEHRLGADGAASTGDDEVFETLAELDAIPYVGPAAFADLVAYVVEQQLCQPSQSFELLLSNYDVDFTFGAGEHQGLGVVEMRSFADCATERSLTYVFNHGRTVNTEPGNFIVLARQTKEFAPEDDIEAEAEYMASCMIGGAGADGFCDSMCGNDGYTLPASLLDAGSRGDRGFGNDLFTARNAFVGDAHRRKAVVDVFEIGPDFPAYGHNSNNDAEAAYDMFRQCDWSQAAEPGAFDELVTHVCERRCGGDFGEPGNPEPTNIAKTRAHFCSGCMNLSDDLPGDLPSGPEPFAGSHGVPFEPFKLVEGL